MKIRFGATEQTEIIDEEGSTIQKTAHYHAAIIKPPIYIRYKLKHRIRNQEEELKLLNEFSEELHKDRSMLEPSCSWEFTKAGDEAGYYHIVKSYTRLSQDV